MPFIDLARMIRAEQEELKAQHRRETEYTTGLHMDADACEDAGDSDTAAALRSTAEYVQTAANKRWYRSN